jgi:membrane protein YqaA with SNARE-associated domain
MQDKNTLQRFASWIREAGASFWFMLVFVLFFAAVFYFDLSRYVNDLVLVYGLIAIFSLSFIFDFLVQPIGPDIPLVAGILLGIPWVHVLLITIAGSMLALIGTYIIGMYIGERGIRSLLGKRRWTKLKEKHIYGKWALFVGAMTPIPFVPYLAGLYRLSFKDCMLYMALPRSVRFLVVALATVYFADFLLLFFGM